VCRSNISLVIFDGEARGCGSLEQQAAYLEDRKTELLAKD
jgi:hypothetical protein